MPERQAALQAADTKQPSVGRNPRHSRSTQSYVSRQCPGLAHAVGLPARSRTTAISTVAAAPTDRCRPTCSSNTTCCEPSEVTRIGEDDETTLPLRVRLFKFKSDLLRQSILLSRGNQNTSHRQADGRRGGGARRMGRSRA